MEGKGRERKRNEFQSHFPNWEMGSFSPRLSLFINYHEYSYHPLTRGGN
jgi:hypothetical protein